MAQSLSLSRLARASAMHVAVGFLLMGAWGIFANRAHGTRAALLAGLVQGTLSGLLTLGLKRGIESLSARLPGMLALVLPPALGFCILGALLVSVHRLMGTPEIAATVAVPLSISTTYAVIYCALLFRARKAAPRKPVP